MFERFTRIAWGNFNSSDELKKFFGLALAAFFLIGAQWPAKLLKDSLLVSFLGASQQPTIKMLSILICFPITILYTVLIEYFRRERIIYIIGGTYVAISLILAGFLKAWSMGIVTNISLLAGAYYLFSETLTAITIPSFWAFVNDITYPEEAKRGYPIIVFFAQLGGLVLTLLDKYIPSIISYIYCCDEANAFYVATPLITLTTTFCLVMFIFFVWETVHIVKKSTLQGYKAKHDAEERKPEQKTATTTNKFSWSSFTSGLVLIATRPYVAGIFMLTAFQEISGSLISYSLLTSVEKGFLSNFAINEFLFNYGLVIQIIAVVFSLAGTSWFQRNIGIRGCLIGYPALLLTIFCVVIYWPTVYVIAMAGALVKGLHYALNKPVREILYIPTSTDIKYRAKAWIEVFGSRAAKTAGASINKVTQTIPGAFGLILTVLPLIWIGAAKLVGEKYHNSVIKKEKIS